MIFFLSKFQWQILTVRMEYIARSMPTFSAFLPPHQELRCVQSPAKTQDAWVMQNIYFRKKYTFFRDHSPKLNKTTEVHAKKLSSYNSTVWAAGTTVYRVISASCNFHPPTFVKSFAPSSI